MQRTTLIFDRTAVLRESFGIEASWWSSAFIADLQTLTMRVTGVTAIVTSAVHIAAESVDGPLVVISGDTPHLPETRLRDAFTLLEAGADLVVGPCDRGGWYLLGIRSPSLAAHLPSTPVLPWLDHMRQQSLRVRQLPFWFRITLPSDLATLATALRTMPATYAPATRRLLGNSDGMLAREWGA
ncbi:DUF2064 domain-containing protein [Chloroflexus aggregans]|uniref:DUF2064 domain-containing protein n=1 Tax=Chloroflexus aggregans (strain MD-66 / DSM 9485) TaxID=326427 RepID=B8G4N0_CHLAD|nr:DUF2064 domain-containing protein [Chloroflexus aggregans]ACL25506.1 conserved hypothetical protein [Chloroflexus aggregans DSM 9485]